MTKATASVLAVCAAFVSLSAVAPTTCETHVFGRALAAAESKSDARTSPARQQAEDTKSKPAPTTKDGRPPTEPPKSPVPAEPSPPAQEPAETKKAGAPEPDTWPVSEIEAAKQRCDKILDKIEIVATPEPPMKSGECGAPAPLRLIAIGKNPEVAVSPPAVVTCELAAALYRWLKDDLQPLARKHFGAEIVRIENISDYSCRHALGRVTTRLSEHGRANALDIRRFVTAKGETADLTDDWGITARERAEMAAAKAAAEKEAAERAAAEKAAQKNLQDQKSDKAKAPPPPPPAATGSPVGMPGGGIVKGTIVDGIPKLAVTLPGAGEPKRRDGRLDAPHSLGGPKLKPVPSAVKPAGGAIPAPPLPPEVPSNRQKFLHAAHEAACRIFGTVLGPEANAAHRNHFHVDMAERHHHSFCE